jgi:hypothetical protein
MNVFSKIVKGSARIHQLSLDSSQSCSDIYHEGSIIITDEILNVHQISALEPVYMLDVMDNHEYVRCNNYERKGNYLTAIS